MTKQNGTIITIVVAIIVFLCCTGPLCSSGIAIFANVGTWSSDFGSYSDSGSIPQAYGIAPCCLSILFLIVPVLCWVFLVRGKEDPVGMEIEEEFEGTIEDDFPYE
ncbi:MAG: hypothetical protein GY832_33140 [Chloroflexi bacterium]|nr:hypothetical protein [Chloroflexota bacterium]